MDIISIVAIILAFFSLSFTVVQWLSRHRPYLGIANLDWKIVYGEYTSGGTVLPDSVDCMIRNVGEAPAKNLTMTATIEALGYGDSTDKKEIKPISLGVLFPKQEVQVILYFNMDSPRVGSAFAGGDGAVMIDSLITYEAVPLFRWHRKHITKQKHIIYQNPKSWRTLSGGNYT